MEREDSGVIDLFAIQKRASEAPPVPEPVMSAPPPAFTTDLLGPPVSHPDLDDLDDDNPFARPPSKKPIYAALAGAGALLVIGIVVAAFSGGDPAPAANASAAHEPAAVATQASPPTPPVAEPAPVAAAVDVPAPPTTAASTASKAPPRKARAKVKKKKSVSSGVKLQKVQSTGI